MGVLLEPVPYVPGGEQLSIEEELGHPIGGGEGISEPQGYRPYVLWWPGSLGLGGAVMAAGVLKDNVQILYASTPLPAPIMEDRSVRVAFAGGADATKGTESGKPGKRRRDDDFGEVDGDGEEDAPPQTS